MTPEQAGGDIITGLKLVRDGWHCLIVAELKQHHANIEAQEESAAGTLAECIAALEKPREEIRLLREDLDKARSQVMQWSAAISGPGDAEDHVEARIMSRGWAEELSLLEEKLALAQADIDPLTRAREAAHVRLQEIQNAKAAVAFCMVTPFISDFAKGTRAYQDFLNDVELLRQGVARSVDVPQEPVAPAAGGEDDGRIGAALAGEQIGAALRRFRGIGT